MKLATSKSLPQTYNRGFIARLLQQIDDQVNNLTDGKVNAVTNSYTAAPTGGTHAVGDFVRNTNTVEIGTAPYNYVILGWVCTIAGTPGTFTEVRADASGAISVGGPGSSTDNAVARWNGTGGNSIQNSVVTIGDTGAVAGVSTVSMSGQLTSTLATGTSPLVVASTTKVANLNADLLDDQSGSYYLDSANFTGTNWTDLTDGGATTLHAHADITGNAGTVTVSNEATDTTCFPLFATAASGSLEPKTNANMTFNSSTGVVTFASAVLTTADINGGTVDGAVIGGSSRAAGNFTTLDASGNVTLGDATTDTVSITGRLINAGEAALDYARTRLGGSFTSGGASTQAQALRVDGTITGASGDTAFLAGTYFANALTTQAAAEAIGVAAQLYVNEPNITIGTATTTIAATVYIANAPTEGATNAAFYSASGNNILGGNTRIGGTTSPTNALDVTGNATVSGTTALGTSTSPANHTKHYIDNTFTSGGASTVAYGTRITGTVTAAAGDTTRHALLVVDPSAMVTQGATEAISLVTSAYFTEPVITVGTGDTITTASTVYIASAPTEGASNYALFIDSGAARFDGIGSFGGDVSTTTQLNLAASTTGVSSIRLAHGSAPSSPVNGDMWTTTAGLYVRINGVTVGPLT